MSGIPCNYPSCIAYEVISSNWWSGVAVGICATIIAIAIGAFIYIDIKK